MDEHERILSLSLAVGFVSGVWFGAIVMLLMR